METIVGHLYGGQGDTCVFFFHGVTTKRNVVDSIRYAAPVSHFGGTYGERDYVHSEPLQRDQGEMLVGASVYVYDWYEKIGFNIPVHLTSRTTTGYSPAYLGAVPSGLFNMIEKLNSVAPEYAMGWISEQLQLPKESAPEPVITLLEEYVRHEQIRSTFKQKIHRMYYEHAVSKYLGQSERQRTGDFYVQFERFASERKWVF